MPMTKVDEYKKNGFIEQKQKGYYAMRIRTRAGNITSEQMRKIAELADKYGQGRMHLTTRQAVEMHWVPKAHYEEIMREILEAGLLPAVCGPRIRTIVACPGNAVCRFGVTDTVSMAEQLDELFVGCEVPAKTKLGISGCPNSCAKPQENDLGLQGVIIPAVQEGCMGCGACTRVCKVKAIVITENKPIIDTEKCVGCGQCVYTCAKQAFVVKVQGYNVFIGGKIGRQPGLGTKIFTAVPENDAVLYIEAIVGVYKRIGNKGERISQTIARIGINPFIAEAETEISKLIEERRNNGTKTI